MEVTRRDALTAVGVTAATAALIASPGAAREAAVACAILSERHAMPGHPATTTCDLLVSERELQPHIARTATELQRAFTRAARPHASEDELRRALLAGYPDRVAKRRAPGDRRLLLSSGHGAALADESGVREGEFLLALDVQAGRRGEGSEARVRIASIVDKTLLEATSVDRVNVIDPSTGELRSFEREMYGAIALRERPVRVDRATAEEYLADAFLARELNSEDAEIVRRLRLPPPSRTNTRLNSGCSTNWKP